MGSFCLQQGQEGVAHPASNQGSLKTRLREKNEGCEQGSEGSAGGLDKIVSPALFIRFETRSWTPAAIAGKRKPDTNATGNIRAIENIPISRHES